MSLFVDTSTWYAAVDAGDASHTRAREILSASEALVTSDHVLVESWTLVRARRDRRDADAFWAGLRSGSVQIESATPADLDVAWQISERFPDQDFSLVDRTSFAVMMRLGLTRAASFDSDFAVFRYGARDRLAFEIVR
jgi:predicted nucleic acid-binding protein